MILRQALRMLARDWRAGELRVLGMALVVAVASVTSVAFFADRVSLALVRDAHQLLGADLVLVSDHPWQAGVGDEISNFENVVGSNLADTLIKLQRYDEARTELLRAIECDKPYGHAAEPWKTFDNLRKLELATGNPQAAAAARQQAIAKYLAYRQAGGGEHEWAAQVCAMAIEAIKKGQIDEVRAQLADSATTESGKLFISRIQAILAGDRNPALAADPNLDYDDAAELQLLLARLGK